MANPRMRTELERDLLRWMAGREVTTPAQLGAKIRRELLARDLRSAARGSRRRCVGGVSTRGPTGSRAWRSSPRS